MKLTICKLLIAFILSITFYSCKHESENPKDLNLTIKLLGNPQCIGLKSAVITAEIPRSQSCLEFSFDQTSSKLSLKHLNAGFNCCPESLSCTVTYRNDSIIIQEIEKHMGCKCNCLYNLDIEVDGVESGKYQLRIIEPYAGNQDKLGFELDLRTKKQGSFCVSRKQYPWGE